MSDFTPDPTPISVIRELIRAHLELAFDHLNTPCSPNLALMELDLARRQVVELQTLVHGPAPRAGSPAAPDIERLHADLSNWIALDPEAAIQNQNSKVKTAVPAVNSNLLTNGKKLPSRP